jgi:hypothetical protein
MALGDDFICECIKPDRATGDTTSMSRGLSGLPAGFTWRDRHVTVGEVIEDWKQSEPCDHHSGERYYRKHYYRIRVDGGEVWTVYALRHMKQGENPSRRWWLYTVETRGTQGDSLSGPPDVGG